MNTTSSRKKINPFYVMLVIAGIIFAITTCAYGAMSTVFVTSYRTLSEQEAAELMEDESTWMNIIDRHGMNIMLVEIVVLTVLTFAAISTDDYWTGGVTVATDNSEALATPAGSSRGNQPSTGDEPPDPNAATEEQDES